MWTRVRVKKHESKIYPLLLHLDCSPVTRLQPFSHRAKHTCPKPRNFLLLPTAADGDETLRRCQRTCIGARPVCLSVC